MTETLKNLGMLVLLAAVLAGCGGVPASPMPPPATGRPASPVPADSPAQTEEATTTSTPEATSPAARVPGGGGPSATVVVGQPNIAGFKTYVLDLEPKDSPIPTCSLGLEPYGEDSVFVYLRSADRRSSLVISLPSGYPFTFSFNVDPDDVNGGRWWPDKPVPFDISGSTATWSGLVTDPRRGRAVRITISIDCGAGS